MGISTYGLVTAARHVGVALALSVGLISVFAISGWIVPPWVFVLALGLPLVGIGLLMDRVDRRYWSVYLVGFVLFAYLRAMADEGPFPVQFDYVVAMERALFLGAVPTVWLQQRLYALGSPSWLDMYTIAIYLTYFFAPHLLALFVWRKRPRVARQYLVAALGCYYAALLTCFLVPTAPPWLAGQTGRLPHVFRIAEDVLTQANPAAYDYAYQIAGTNAVAAMPSLHFGIAMMMAIAVGHLGGLGRWLGALYAVSMAFTLVYTGEHYVVDLLLGGLVAVVMWRMAGSATPVAEPAPHAESSSL